MKKWKKILLYLFVIGLVVGGIVFYKVTKAPETAADSKPVKELKAEDLISELSNNKKLVDSTYMLKNIAVNGKISEISSTSVFIDAGPSCLINCSFDSATFEQCKAQFKVGAEANIKGIYSGCDGFDAVDPTDMLASVSGKNVILKTCAINKK